MATISSLGIGSGLDLNTLLDNLTAAEKGALTPITTQQTAYTAKLTAYGTLKSALSAFQTANTALASADIYKSSNAVSSASSSFTATSATGAAAGKYTIAVSQIAQAQSLTSAKVTGNTSNIGTAGATNRTLTITQPGSTKPISISLTDSQTTLSGVRDAINNADAGVSASIIKVDSTNYQLILTSDTTGTDGAMSISVSGDDALQSFIGYDATQSTNGLKQTVVAQNAKLSINGIDIERSSNSISDVPEGVTLQLLDTTTGNQSLTVSDDNSKATAAINSWVSAYNALQTTFSSLTTYTAVDAGADQSSTNGALLGDSTLRSIQTQIKAQLSNAASSSTFKSLSQIGVTQDPTTGQLTTDSDKLSKALASDSKGVMEMIVGDGKTNGIATSIGNSLTSYLSTTGILTAATTGVNNTLKDLTEQYNKTNDRITTTIAMYKTKFTQLDVMMNSLNSTSSYLTQQFESMNQSSKS